MLQDELCDGRPDEPLPLGGSQLTVSRELIQRRQTEAGVEACEVMGVGDALSIPLDLVCVQ